MKRELPVIPVHPLPPLYGSWMDQLLAGPIPAETKATCDDCAMASSTTESSGSDRFFDPVLKCCTYMPTLPNFIVGRILSDSGLSTDARAGVQARLLESDTATPLGLSMSATYSLLYAHQDSDVFGRSQNLRCPHLLEEGGGSCGIWRHRNSVCATYFCKFTRGAVGQQFWVAMLHLLATIESDLARWCLLELELDGEALQTLLATVDDSTTTRRLDANAIAGLRDHRQYKMLWGNWFGREQEFYRECARLVEGLDWPRVISACGPGVGIRAQLVREAYRELLSEEISPGSLKAGDLNVRFLDQDSYRVSTYGPLDPMIISRTLMELLPYFDGRPTEEVLSVIKKEKHITLNPALLRKLLDFRILVASDRSKVMGS